VTTELRGYCSTRTQARVIGVAALSLATGSRREPREP
jgi:hypothetical protein